MAAVLCRSGAKWVAASDVGAPLRCAGLVTTAKKATLRPVLSPWFVTKGRLPVLGGTTHPSGSRARRRARFPSTPVVFLNTTGTPEVLLRCVTNRRGPQLRAPRGDYPLPPWKEERRKSLRRDRKADYEIAARRLLRHPARRVERHFCYEGNEPFCKFVSKWFIYYTSKPVVRVTECNRQSPRPFFFPSLSSLSFSPNSFRPTMANSAAYQ